MIYDLSNSLAANQFKVRCNSLYSKKAVVELTEKTQRTKPQNAYLHLILSYFGLEKGYTLEEVKREFLKETVCPDIFITGTHYDTLLKRNKNTLKSTKDLTKEEMSVVIEKFKLWALKEAEVYLPDAEDVENVRQMEIEVMKNQKWI